MTVEVYFYFMKENKRDFNNKDNNEKKNACNDKQERNP